MKYSLKRCFAVGVACLGGLPACQSYLDVTPVSVANVNAFYKTREDAVVATNAVYNALQEPHREALWLLGEVLSDNTEDPNLDIDNFAFDANDGTVTNAWRYHYLGITRANTVLNRLPGIRMDESLRNRLMLEARFLRAYFYFNLVRLFGDVPLVTAEVAGLPDDHPARASREAVYAQIIDDLVAAEALPDAYPSTEAGRATRGAALGLLAKVHLTRGEWSLAAVKARAVVESGTYALLPGYADVFTAAHKNSRESLFEVQYFVGAQSGTGNPVSNNFFELFAPAGSGSAVTGVPNANAFGRNVPTADVVSAYEPGDRRREASLGTSYTQPGNPPREVRVNYTTKYLDASATAGGLGTGSSNGWRVLRYADVLLVYAEAL
ncbi:MAG: RagB/SusD family nutrient uptake outer membrane protein, partial [Cytophagales bacterium]|nr:RagB/SusD family nutrient uptake outer membrane protein [Cytophagales bacterium]